jgi:hypothetical protein
MTIRAGYKFKETHIDIHYIKTNHGRAGEPYSVNFTEEIDCAKVFEKQTDAEDLIMKLMSKFERHDDYRWTPIILNENMRKTIICSQWH